MKKEIIFMKIENGKVGFNYQKKIINLQKGQEVLLENVSDILIPQQKEESPLHIPNPYKVIYKENEIRIFEQHKSNPWRVRNDGQLIQKGTFDGHDISYLEDTYGIGHNMINISQRYLAIRKKFY